MQHNFVDFKLFLMIRRQMSSLKINYFDTSKIFTETPYNAQPGNATTLNVKHRPFFENI